MKLKTIFLCFLLIIAYRASAFAQDGKARQTGPLVLTGERDSYPLGLHLEILEDPGGELTIEDVSSPEYAEQFSSSQVEVPNYGFSDSAYWVRLHLRNESSTTDQWYLELGYANMHFVDLYRPPPDGSGYQVTQSGLLRPSSNRDLLYPKVVFILSMPDQSEKIYYLRFENGASMTLPLVLWEPSAFFAHAIQNLAWHAIFWGIMVGLLGYNLFLFISLRDTSYLYLVLLLGGIVIYDVVQSGLLGVYVFPDLYLLNEPAVIFSVALIFIALILFNDAFVSAAKLLPRVHLVNLAFVALWAVLGFTIFLVSYHDLALVIAPLIIVTLVLAAVNGLLAWRNGFRATRFLLIAWAGLLAGVLLFIFTRMGIAPSSVLTENSYRLGSAWMAVCWSIALADRINVFKAETENANLELQHSRQRLVQTLEAMPVGVAVYGSDQKPTFANRRAVDILANPSHDVVPAVAAGRTLSQAMDYYAFRVAGTEQPYPLERLPIQRALQGETSSIDDIEADLRDRRVALEILASPIWDEAGNVEAAVVAFQDITKRKQSETDLRASEAHFRVIVENVFDGIAFLDRDREVLYVSPSYKQLNGKSPEELIGQSGIATIHPDDRVYVAQTFQELLQQPGGRVREEYRILHRDGSWVWVETRAVNLLDDPHVQAVVLNSRNITERRNAETEIASYRQHLEQLVQERTEELSASNEQLAREMAERAVLEEWLEKRIVWMSRFNQARQDIRGSADLPDTFDILSALMLDLLGAVSVFFLRWDGLDRQVDFFCAPAHAGSGPDKDKIAASLAQESPLRSQLELGEIIVLPIEEAALLPAPLGNCLQEFEWRTLLLAPTTAGEPAAGVLGVVLAQPVPELATAQSELVGKMALDLAGLAEYTAFLDQSRVLVAAGERNRLARDLHDSVTQVLFSASLVAEVLPQIWRRDPDRGMQSLEELRRLTRAALAEMRTMLLELRPAALAKTSLAELLTQLTEAGAGRAGLRFKLFIEQTPRLPEAVHAAYYRIAQEALNNVSKHAQAAQVTVSLSATPPAVESDGRAEYEVQLVIEDDGVGFAPQSKKLEHMGLSIMSERTADIQASLTIDSRVGEGTRVTLLWCGAARDES